jgi:hypothetical protein
MDHDRPIEKLLRRYAKKRRTEAGTPLELHPATRRLLQGEVARQIPKPEAGGRTTFAERFGALQRRWVYATAAGAVAIAGVLLVLNRTTPPAFDLAKNEPTFAKSPARKPAPGDSELDVARQSDFAAPAAAQGVIAEAPAPALTPPTERHEASGPNRDQAGALTLDADTKRARTLSDEPAAVSPAATPASSPTVALVKKSLEQKAAASGAKLEELAGATRADKLASTLPAGAGENEPTSPSAAAALVASESRRYAPSAREGGLEREKVPEYSQSFLNIQPRSQTKTTLEAPPVSPVLLNFKVEQTGDRVAVIDSDGSTYFGKLSAEPVTLNKANNEAQFKDAAKLLMRRTGVPAATATPTQTYFFRATGTNRTLNQSVVFTWNFVELTNALAHSKTKGVGAVHYQDGSSMSQQFPAWLQNSAINGRAQINAAREFEINAVPVLP